MDGLRIISTESCDFIEKVPGKSRVDSHPVALLNSTLDASLAVFAPGSRHKAASLVEALDCFEQGLPRANEFIRGIKADLAGAVDTCIEAAGLESDPVWQKKLLRVRATQRW